MTDETSNTKLALRGDIRMRMELAEFTDDDGDRCDLSHRQVAVDLTNRPLFRNEKGEPRATGDQPYFVPEKRLRYYEIVSTEPIRAYKTFILLGGSKKRGTKTAFLADPRFKEMLNARNDLTKLLDRVVAEIIEIPKESDMGLSAKTLDDSLGFDDLAYEADRGGRGQFAFTRIRGCRFIGTAGTSNTAGEETGVAKSLNEAEYMIYVSALPYSTWKEEDVQRIRIFLIPYSIVKKIEMSVYLFLMEQKVRGALEIQNYVANVATTREADAPKPAESKSAGKETRTMWKESGPTSLGEVAAKNKDGKKRPRPRKRQKNAEGVEAPKKAAKSDESHEDTDDSADDSGGRDDSRPDPADDVVPPGAPIQ